MMSAAAAIDVSIFAGSVKANKCNLRLKYLRMGLFTWNRLAAPVGFSFDSNCDRCVWHQVESQLITRFNAKTISNYFRDGSLTISEEFAHCGHFNALGAG